MRGVGWNGKGDCIYRIDLIVYIEGLGPQRVLNVRRLSLQNDAITLPSGLI